MNKENLRKGKIGQLSIRDELQALVKAVEESGVFDQAFYKSQLADPAVANGSYIEHYLTEGWITGINPHPCFDTKHYLASNKDLHTLSYHPFLHFIKFGYLENRETTSSFDLTTYRNIHPTVQENNENPLRHFLENYDQVLYPAKVKLSSTRVYISNTASELDIRSLMEDSKRLGLFDYTWYQDKYKLNFPGEIEAFKDYLRKSRFSPVNPSIQFDTENYHKRYNDVYHAQISPLHHYLVAGQFEGRSYLQPANNWTPTNILDVKSTLSTAAYNQQIAICLHIFYEDYIERFSKALQTFPCKFDLLLTVTSDAIAEKSKAIFKLLPCVKKIVVRVVPNRGRNFGPLLVEYAECLLSYDLVCHLHSKKSLYSGREQTQWSEYLTEYLIRDTAVVTKILNGFSENPELGLYYPTTYWMMPSWVNHTTMNRGFMKTWTDSFEIPEIDGFLAYPAGGMFWMRPRAVRQLLTRNFVYEDFPDEPLPNDGSMLHALERVVGRLCESNGYKQFFYSPSNAQFTLDQSFTTIAYRKTEQALTWDLSQYSHISFDIFDTLIRRKRSTPDFAKHELGLLLAKIGVVSSAAEFVNIRNSCESQIRERRAYKGDVGISEIYNQIASVLDFKSTDPQKYANLEFEFDLAEIMPKDEMIDIVNLLGSKGHIIWLISDTYYTRDQVSLMLKKAGLSIIYRLMVSSEEQKRKDNGTMWHMVKNDLKSEQVTRHIHVGDNVVADCQIPGDLGIPSIHLLHPYDKWKALGFPQFDGKVNDTTSVEKWGRLVNCIGRWPFL